MQQLSALLFGGRANKSWILWKIVLFIKNLYAFPPSAVNGYFLHISLGVYKHLHYVLFDDDDDSPPTNCAACITW